LFYNFANLSLKSLHILYLPNFKNNFSFSSYAASNFQTSRAEKEYKKSEKWLLKKIKCVKSP